MNVNEQWVEFAYYSAGQNWLKWRLDFECHNPKDLPVLKERNPKDLPVLKEKDKNQKKYRFAAFLSEYGLARNISKTHRENVRQWLQINVSDMIECESGKGIDCATDRLENEILKEATFKRLPALTSKIAAFAKPSHFIAKDSTATKGVVRILDLKKRPQSYADFLDEVRKIQDGEVGVSIASTIGQRGAPGDARAFALRVLDVYLMVAGGRWSGQRELHPEGRR